VLGNVKFIQEKKILNEYFERIAQDLGTYCFGIDDTLKALEMGAVETLLCWEDLPMQRVVLLNSQTSVEVVKLLTEEQLEDDSNFKDAETGGDLEIKEKKTLVEWLCEHYKDFGAAMVFVTNKSTEGSQFCRGFGGIGGLLRYKVDFMEMDDWEEEDAGKFEDGADEFEDCFI